MVSGHFCFQSRRKYKHCWYTNDEVFLSGFKKGQHDSSTEALSDDNRAQLQFWPASESRSQGQQMLHLHTCPEESANCENDGEHTRELMTISLLLWMSFIRITNICWNVSHVMPMHGFTKSRISYIFWPCSIFPKLSCAEWQQDGGLRQKRPTTRRTHTYCFPPYNSWVQHLSSSNSRQPTCTAFSMPQCECGWLDLDQIKLTMDLGLQILFKKEALYMKMNLLTWALSYMSRGGDSLRSHLFDAGCIHMQDARPAWDLCRCPRASWERSPEDSLCQGPGSTVGTSTCPSTWLLPPLTSFPWYCGHVPRLLRAVCIWATAISWGI